MKVTLDSVQADLNTEPLSGLYDGVYGLQATPYPNPNPKPNSKPNTL